MYYSLNEGFIIYLSLPKYFRWQSPLIIFKFEVRYVMNKVRILVVISHFQHFLP